MTCSDLMAIDFCGGVTGKYRYFHFIHDVYLLVYWVTFLLKAMSFLC